MSILKLDINVDLSKFSRRSQTIKRDLRRYIGEGLIRGVMILSNYIHRVKLSGSPLKYQTGRLYRATTYSSQVQEGPNGTLEAFVYTDLSQAPYGRVHEYGGIVNIREYIKRSVTGRIFTVHGHTVNYPQRSYLRSAFEEMKSEVEREVKFSILEAVGFDN